MLSSLYLKMLNKKASSAKMMPGKIIKSLLIKKGHAVADIGSGGGYFTREFAIKVGKTGRVYAVDAQAKNLNFIRRQSEKEGLANIVCVQATGNTVTLPDDCLDLMFVRNAFHHLPQPMQYFRNLKRFLKKDGKVAIIEHKPRRGWSHVALFKHYTPVTVIMREMEEAGYQLVRSFDLLPAQSFTIFGVGKFNKRVKATAR
jgi:arsenite methyltransferase